MNGFEGLQDKINNRRSKRVVLDYKLKKYFFVNGALSLMFLEGYDSVECKQVSDSLISDCRLDKLKVDPSLITYGYAALDFYNKFTLEGLEEFPLPFIDYWISQDNDKPYVKMVGEKDINLFVFQRLNRIRFYASWKGLDEKGRVYKELMDMLKSLLALNRSKVIETRTVLFFISCVLNEAGLYELNTMYDKGLRDDFWKALGMVKFHGDYNLLASVIWELVNNGLRIREIVEKKHTQEGFEIGDCIIKGN